MITCGCLSVGVAERPCPPGATKQQLNEKCGRWMGYGFLNNRASFRSRVSNIEDNVSSYGDHFHSGDIVGVLLDMNRGRLSFYLDGMRYGEHILADLGEAFDGLSTPNAVQKRTLYPVVGLQRPQDRVTITPRWMSAIGATAKTSYSYIEKAWKLLTHWNTPRIQALPLTEDTWIYRAAWRDWLSWHTHRFLIVRTRMKTHSVDVALDTHPISFVEASIRLGLPHVLYRGDRIQFSKTSGRVLEKKEEAIILGMCTNIYICMYTNIMHIINIYTVYFILYSILFNYRSIYIR